MLFNSMQYPLFLMIVVLAYFAMPYRWRWVLLLLSSYYFYMSWNATYAILIFTSTVIGYMSGIMMSRTEDNGKKKGLLIFSLLINLGILFLFKYFNFFSSSLNSFIKIFGIPYQSPCLNVLLPVGISFYTFQVLSYSIDVYTGRKKPEIHFGIFALYVSFFPQLVAGPIERSTRLLPQFFEKHSFSYDRFLDGLKMIVWGFFMKLAVADRVGIYVDAVYNNPTHHNGTSLLLATLFFTFQIYCDFAGYSNIAIGSAKLMGYELMTNFSRPYLARSLREFWQRWHISLSTWFRDYLYIPLGGSRCVKWRHLYNLYLTFLISGLWHGANWTFFVWGGLHGLYLVFSNLAGGVRKKIAQALHLNNFQVAVNTINIIITFLLVAFAWIFFRANSITDAFIIIKKIATEHGSLYIGSTSQVLYSVVAIALLFIKEIKNEFFENIFSLSNNKNWVVQQTYYAGLIIYILLFGVFDGGQFIYFQF